jgi:hypothetical protein
VTLAGEDFTFPTYRRLLQAGLGANYAFLTVREYVERRRAGTETAPGDAARAEADGGDGLPERFLIMRHDVDRKPRNALAMAHIEAEYGIQSTYYVRTVEGTFDPAVVSRLAGLGHEVGYHYEDLDRADGDPEAAVASFRHELARLRALVPVDTVCMHGNPLTAHDNRDMWDHADLDAFDLTGEAYLSMDFDDVTYFSDTGRTWRDGDLKIKDHTRGEGEKAIQVDTSFDLADAICAGRFDRACVLTHPNRWAGSVPELLTERAKDTAVNVVKRGLVFVS